MSEWEDVPWCPWGCSINQLERVKWAKSFYTIMFNELAIGGDNIIVNCPICKRKIDMLIDETHSNFLCYKGE